MSSRFSDPMQITQLEEWALYDCHIGLFVDEPLPMGDGYDLQRIDTKPALFQAMGTETGIEMSYPSLNLARLEVGLWLRCGCLLEEVDGIPLKVARDGKMALAAYLRTNRGDPRTGQAVAGMLDTTPQTIYNYCDEIRWTPDSERYS